MGVDENNHEMIGCVRNLGLSCQCSLFFGEIIIFLIFVLFSYVCSAKPVSLLNTGILKERDAVKRYWKLQQAHKLAEISDSEIDYSGIDSLSIEIPRDAVSIPINKSCDFKSLKLHVVNNYKDFELFTLKNIPKSVSLSSKQIDSNAFSNIPTLAKGTKLLCVCDKTPWVAERKGYGYPAYRKDIILIKKGVACNSCIRPYNDGVSDPECFYVDLAKKRIILSNIKIYRSKESRYKTFCFSIDYQNEILLQNITIITPEAELYGDRAITIKNSTNIFFEDVIIEGSYSRKDKYGYGISLDNVWNSSFKNLKASAKWGIFGNNNINLVNMKDCDINRFDIHNYGKDITFLNTVFRNLYNQFSSVYGCIQFSKCRFINFTPVLIEGSYQTYTPFDIIIKDCCFFTETTPSCIVKMGASNNSNDRPGLGNLKWPNLEIYGLQVKGSKTDHTLELYSTTNKNKIFLDGKLKINISRLKLESPFNVKLCNRQIIARKGLSKHIINSDIKELQLK